MLALAILLMSGLAIFNAHPSLVWGKSSYTGTPSLFEITSRTAPDGRELGIARVFGHEFDTTGVLGASTDTEGQMVLRAFPAWITVPGYYSLAEARNWHFLFASKAMR